MSTSDSGKVQKKKKMQAVGHFLQETTFIALKKKSTQETALIIRTFQGMSNRKRKCEHFKNYVQRLEGFPGDSEG